MAQKYFDAATLRMSFVKGTNEEGKELFTTKSFTGMKEDATAAQLQQFSTAIASLTTYELAKTFITTQHTVE